MDKNIAFLNKKDFKKIIWEKVLQEKVTLDKYIEKKCQFWFCPKCKKKYKTIWIKIKESQIPCCKICEKEINIDNLSKFSIDNNDWQTKIDTYFNKEDEYNIAKVFLFEEKKLSRSSENSKKEVNFLQELISRMHHSSFLQMRSMVIIALLAQNKNNWISGEAEKIKLERGKGAVFYKREVKRICTEKKYDLITYD